MLTLSELLIAHPELEGFDELREIRATLPAMPVFCMDVRPPYTDTPDNWEDVLESTFSGVLGR